MEPLRFSIHTGQAVLGATRTLPYYNFYGLYNITAILN